MSKNSFEIITLEKSNLTDFAKERNNLLKKAKSEWVLFLDSDEKLTKDLRNEILEVINSGSGKDGYYLFRKNYFVGQYVGTDNILRLAKKDAGKWKRKVHETWKVNGNVGQLQSPLIHNTADTVFEMVEKINRYSLLHSEANREEGKKASLFNIVFYPKLKFFQSLIMGRGTVFSILQAFHSFLSWSELQIMQSNSKYK